MRLTAFARALTAATLLALGGAAVWMPAQATLPGPTDAPPPAAESIFGTDAATGIGIVFTPLITSGLSSPLFVTHAGDDRLFIVEKGGKIKIFQGGALKDGPQAGFRLQNGWQNSGLPWSAKMNPEKIHRIDRP